MSESKKIDIDPRHPQMALSKRLQVGKEIDTGGMGTVWETYDSNLKRTVARKERSKKLPPELVEFVRGRLIEEAQVTAQLDHPNIVPVYELGVDEKNEIFFTMKRVTGKKLSDILEEHDCRHRTSSHLFEQLEIFLKVCDTVAFAHSCGIVHRDLKPDNIMVGDFGVVYVMDWGLARKKDDLSVYEIDTVVPQDSGYRYPSRTRVGSTFGTLWYMPPEQALGKSEEIDEITDVFMLGGILYEILTHFPPYEAKSEKEMMAKTIEADIDSPYERTNSYLPRTLCSIAMKALKKSKADRYQSVMKMKQAVGDFMYGGGLFERRVFPSGSIIFKENDIGNEAYIITRGRCRAFRTIEGNKVILREMGPREVFGEIALLTDKRRSASVETIDAVQLQVVRQKDFEKELGMDIWLGSFMKTLAERFKEKDKQLTECQQKMEQIKRR